MRIALAVSALVFAAASLARSSLRAVPLPDVARVRGSELPNVEFEDEAHQRRELASLGGQPLIVLPIDTDGHPGDPSAALQLKDAVRDAGLDARSFRVFLFSLDARTSVARLRAFRRALQLPASWVLARLDAQAIRALTFALDYRVVWREGVWAHPSTVAFASPDQRIAMFLYGTRISGRELRSALRVTRAGGALPPLSASWTLVLGFTVAALSLLALGHLLGRLRQRG